MSDDKYSAKHTDSADLDQEEEFSFEHPADKPLKFDVAHRKLSRKVAAMLLVVMADQDISFEYIAAQLGVTPNETRHMFNKFAEGEGTDLRHMSNLATAMDCSWDFTMLGPVLVSND